jgi:hypothetical protein
LAAAGVLNFWQENENKTATKFPPKFRFFGVCYPQTPAPFWENLPRSDGWLHSLTQKVRNAIITNSRSPYFEPTSVAAGSLAVSSSSGQSSGSELLFLTDFKKEFENLDPDNKLEILTEEIPSFLQRGIRYVASFLVIGPIKRLALAKNGPSQIDINDIN